jgi:hypothetical protein
MATLSTTVEVALGADLSADPATWVWTNVTTYARGEVRVVRGRPDLAQVQPAQCVLRLLNTDSRFTPRHLMSAYYGQWGQGTPLRVKLNPGTGSVVRFQGFVASVQPDWPAGNSGYAEAIVTAAGALRRLSQGTTLKSSPVRYIPTTSPLAYWPLEDGELVTVGAPLVGPNPLVPFIGTHPSGAVATYPTFGRGELAPWLKPVTNRMGNSGLTILWATVPTVIYLPGATTWTVDFMYASGTDANVTTVDVNPSYLAGSLGWPQVILTPSSDGFDVAMNGEPEVTATVAGLYDGRAHHIRWTASQSSTKVAWAAWVDGIAVNSGVTTGAMTLPTMHTIALTTSEQSGSAVAQGHLAVWASPPPLADAVAAAMGHVGELASTRVTRLCTEEGVTVAVTGTSTVAMGPQYPVGLVSLLRECADADQGLLGDGLSAGVTYLAGAGRYNAAVVMALDVNRRHVKLPFGPVDDDSRTRNDITAMRTDGSSARYVNSNLADPLSTTRVGVYDDQVTVNVESDSDLLDQAAWRVHLGTVAEMRVPTLRIMPSDTPEITASWLACDLGSRYTLVHTPDQYPSDLDQVLEYYTETFDKVTWTVQLVGSPASAWRVNTVENLLRGRLETGGSQLASSVTTTATSWSLATTVLPLWTTNAVFPADFPFDLNCEGEQVRVTALVGTSSPQTATVTRSINGLVKAHSAGAAVSLWQPAPLAL